VCVVGAQATALLPFQRIKPTRLSRLGHFASQQVPRAAAGGGYWKLGAVSGTFWKANVDVAAPVGAAP
jgi:hypothetical protein